MIPVGVFGSDAADVNGGAVGGVPVVSLVSARRAADRIATAAGMRLGGIVGLSDGAGGVVVPTAAARTGDFSKIFDPLAGIPSALPVLSFASFLLAPVPIQSTAGSLVVQFRLLP
jgi:hypothetical protein